MSHVHIIGMALLALTAASPTKTAKESESPIHFPAGYREWNHIKTMAITSDKHPLFNAFSGLHHVYGNDLALKAAKAHTTYPEGSILVLDLYEWDETDGAYTPGPRKLLAVMQKDSKKFKDTGGWGFEGFKGGDPKERIVSDPVMQCYNCHASQKEHDSVFSRWQE